jgi:1-acyl-sn-glycerol-3-phosphate acyltransferase
MQRANAERWRAFWSDRGPALRREIDRAGKQLGFSTDAFEPFWSGLGRVREPVDPAALDGTVLGDALGQRIVGGEGGPAYVLSTFYLGDPKRIDEVASRIRRVVPGAVVVSGRAFVERAAAIARESLERLGIVSALVVSAILFVFFGRLELTAAVCLPLGLSLFWTLGALGLAGVSVNMFNSLIIIFIFGMAVDYSIFIVGEHLSAYRREGQDLAVTGGAITISALTTVAGFGALVLARHPALFSIGLTAAIGMGTGLAAALLAAPLIMRVILYRDGESGVPTFLSIATLAIGFAAFCGALLICRVVAGPVILVLSPFDTKKRRRRTNAVLRFLCRVLVVYYPYGRRRYIGMDFLTQGGGGKILVVNHNSIIDILCALTLPIDVRMVVKSWVWHAPLMGPAVRAAGNVFARGGDAEDVLAQCEELLRDGASVLMFPEGTRSRTGAIGRFHVGAFELAARSGADIVPIIFTGTRECVPKNCFWAGDHEIVIKASEPMRASEGETSRELMHRVKERMLAEWERAIAIAGDGVGFRKAMAARYTYRGAFLEHYVKWKLKLDPVYRALHGMLPEEGRILDLGCGHGLASNYLATQSTRREIVGVDADERKIAAARGSAVAPARMRFEVADILEWEIPEAAGALLIDVLHYWPPETQERICARIAAALPRGAKFVMREACRAEGAGHWLVRLTERFGTFIGHNRSLHALAFRSEAEYSDMLARAGFTRVEVKRGLGLGSNVVFECEKSDE